MYKCHSKHKIDSKNLDPRNTATVKDQAQSVIDPEPLNCLDPRSDNCSQNAGDTLRHGSTVII